MASPWFQALFAAPRSVMGVRLLPLSLIHYVTLRNLGNPYVTGELRDRGALLMALYVCSRSWIQLKRDLFWNPSGTAMLRFAMRKLAYKFEPADESFRVYLDDYQTLPEHWTKDGDDEPSDIRAPWEFHVVRVLCGEFGMTTSEAWNTPYNLAHAYLDTWAETKGNSTLISERQQALIEMAKGT